MKKLFLIAAFMLYLFANNVFAQDIPQSQVPSLVLNSFQKDFPKAFDVEWEMSGDLYKVEFETGLLGTDHDAWYDKTGKLVKHKEEIAANELPQKVTAKITAEFNGYTTKDPKRITEGGKATYKVELKAFNQEWDVVFDAEGNILSKVAD